MAAPYTYYTNDLLANSPKIVARRESGEVATTNFYPNNARYQYSHATVAAGVGDVLPAGSTLVSTRTSG